MTSAAPALRCRVCYESIPEGASRCPKCNAAVGDLPPCPHCRAIAGVSPDKEFRFRCDVCGGPRVPIGVATGGKEVPFLKAADAARKGRAGWRGAAIFFGLATPFITALLMLFALMFGIGVAWLFGAVVTLTPFVIGLFVSLSKAKARARELGPALDAAWVSVASDLAAAKGGAPSAAELAARLGVDESQAEELAALSEVSDPPVNLRVASQRETTPNDAAALELAAEEEAAAADAGAAVKRGP